MLCPLKFSHYEFEGGQDCIGAECGMFKRCNADNEITAVEFDALDEHAQALERENAEMKAKLGQMTVERDILQDCVDDLNADTSELQAKLAEYESKSEICTILSGGKIYTGGKALTERIAELQAKVDELTTERDRLYNDLEKAVSRTDKLIRCLEDDYGITASWGGLLNVWQIENNEHDLLEQVHAECTELQKQVDELTSERDKLRDKVRHQSRQLTDTQNALENRNEEIKPRWKRDIKKLQNKIDELTTENAKLSSDELHLRQALASAEYDNATLREKLGRILDNAHEITRIGGDC